MVAGDDIDEQYGDLPLLAAVAPQAQAARFTVVTAEPLDGAGAGLTSEVQRAVARGRSRRERALAAARLRSSRVVTLRASGPLIELDEPDAPDRPWFEEELRVVALPLSDSDSDSKLRQLCLLDAEEADNDGHRGWLSAAEGGRGRLRLTRASNDKAPSGWEAFDVFDFQPGDAAGGDETGAAAAAGDQQAAAGVPETPAASKRARAADE